MKSKKVQKAKGKWHTRTLARAICSRRYRISSCCAFAREYSSWTQIYRANQQTVVSVQTENCILYKFRKATIASGSWESLMVSFPFKFFGKELIPKFGLQLSWISGRTHSTENSQHNLAHGLPVCQIRALPLNSYIFLPINRATRGIHVSQQFSGEEVKWKVVN